MKTFYATIVDANYVAMGLNLYRSFAPFLGNKTFGLFCTDDRAADILSSFNLPNAWVFRPADFETAALKKVRAERAINEYCWTCKPAMLQVGFAHDASFDWGVYLDSDMMAFLDPDLALPAARSIVLAPHRFATPEFASFGPSVGRFNGGYAAFRNVPEGHRALAWWAERCLEACPAVPTETTYADQKYLDAMPSLFADVCQSAHKGLDAAPWNIQGYALSARDGYPHLDEDPLLIYHFQGLKILGLHIYDLYAGSMKIPAEVARLIYRPFILNLRDSLKLVHARVPGPRLGIPRFTWIQAARQARRILRGNSNLAVV